MGRSHRQEQLLQTIDIAMWALVLSVVVAVAQGRPSNIPNNGLVTPLGNIGTSGIVPLNGAPTLFNHDLAHDILFFGPSGIITKSGRNVQLTADLQLATPGRSKRSIPNNGLVTASGNIGTSGIVPLNGPVTLFSHDLAHDILFFGPSGIITKSGNNIQLTEDLQLATPGRSKRHIIGDSGMLTSWGQAIQFREPFTTIVLEGPSGILLSDGQHIQKPNGA